MSSPSASIWERIGQRHGTVLATHLEHLLLQRFYRYLHYGPGANTTPRNTMRNRSHINVTSRIHGVRSTDQRAVEGHERRGAAQEHDDDGDDNDSDPRYGACPRRRVSAQNSCVYQTEREGSCRGWLPTSPPSDDYSALRLQPRQLVHPHRRPPATLTSSGHLCYRHPSSFLYPHAHRVARH